jgi:hypothetical protein
MGGIDHSRLIFLTVWTEHPSLQVHHSIRVPANIAGMRAAMSITKSYPPYMGGISKG